MNLRERKGEKYFCINTKTVCIHYSEEEAFLVQHHVRVRDSISCLCVCFILHGMNRLEIAVI